MPLFNLSDIEFNKDQAGGLAGPLSSLFKSSFDQNTLRYPADVGNADKGHYMVIYARKQKNSNLVTAGEATNSTPATGLTFTGPTSMIPSDVMSAMTGGLKSAQDMLSGSGVELSKLTADMSSELSDRLNGSMGELTGGMNDALAGLQTAMGEASAELNNVIGEIGNVFAQKNILIGGNSAQSTQQISNSIKRITQNNFLKNQTVLTTDAIALYMPDTLMYQYNQSYDAMSVGSDLFGGAGKSALDEYEKTGKFSDAAMAGFKNAGLQGAQGTAETIGTLLGSKNSATIAFTATTGVVRNPMLEMIYKSPSFRQFQFDFTFYPRDEKEALQVQQIIERLRFHQAPEFAGSGGEVKGFLIPPSEFDIKFYYAGAENPNIPPIATCVLTSIQTNYAPGGFNAYEVPGQLSPTLGGTGMPVAIQLTLGFQETTYLTKQDYSSAKDTSVSGTQKTTSNMDPYNFG
jgi:hypothetical protein